MKKIIITGGPTNEFIDEVMKITNMSTGSIAISLGSLFLNAGYKVHLILNRAVNTKELMACENAADNLTIDAVETTDEMLNALHEASKAGDADALIHASAVGDYKADYTFLLEDLAAHLWKKLEAGDIKSEADLLKVMEEDKDCYQIDNSSKISSYQKNLTVKLGLTPKIIARLKEWYPNTLLIGCKLLENVSKEELYDVATKLCKKNNMDYILANDLADLRAGDPSRHLCTKDGFTGTKLETAADIFEFVNSKLA